MGFRNCILPSRRSTTPSVLLDGAALGCGTRGRRLFSVVQCDAVRCDAVRYGMAYWRWHPAVEVVQGRIGRSAGWGSMQCKAEQSRKEQVVEQTQTRRSM